MSFKYHVLIVQINMQTIQWSGWSFPVSVCDVTENQYKSVFLTSNWKMALQSGIPARKVRKVGSAGCHINMAAQKCQQEIKQHLNF